MKLHLGKGEARPDPRDFKFSKYLDRVTLVRQDLTDPKLTTTPGAFGFDHAIPPKAWGMLGNDEYGDCVWAGAAHEHMLLGARGSGPESFTTAPVLNDYAACTGFNPSRPDSDNGTDVHLAMKYRQQAGILDASGNRHHIGAYLSVDHTNLAEIWQALYVCEVVGLGIQFPESAMSQFNLGKPWSVIPDSPIEGGHYVPIVSKQAKTCKVVTWGSLTTMTLDFLTTYADECFAYVSVDALNSKGVTRRGLNIDALNQDLAAL